MEKIVIKDFLIFKDIEMPINKFNILIGEQASGKSLLAKLIYFFRNIGRKIFESTSEGESYEDFIISLNENFLDYFPLNCWNENKSFTIKYFYNENFEIVLKSDKRKKCKHSIILSDDLIQLYEKCLDIYDSYQELMHKYESVGSDDLDIDEKFFDIKMNVSSKIYNTLKNNKGFLDSNGFVPSSRSFFSVLEKNSFSLLVGNRLNIDPFMKSFGSTFQGIKNFYKRNVYNDGNFNNENIIKKYFYGILKGYYQEIDGEDWLVGDDYKVSFSRASSGQQEAFPLMLILATMAGIKNRVSFDLLFIEEPEAHLFPNAQSQVVSALLALTNKFDTKFFITTHSPYIISALNNSIYANELIKEKKMSEVSFLKMSNGSYPIDINDISAFSVSSGILTDIKDYEYKMIGGDILDSVSNEFGQVMDQLMELDD